ncbi:MAG: hypothetical protein H6738_10155 [Alphaproteobacteria bacterium]|nr:hypothetical protein [Alphaproteobacteria bacterium]
MGSVAGAELGDQVVAQVRVVATVDQRVDEHVGRLQARARADRVDRGPSRPDLARPQVLRQEGDQLGVTQPVRGAALAAVDEVVHQPTSLVGRGRADLEPGDRVQRRAGRRRHLDRPHPGRGVVPPGFGGRPTLRVDGADPQAPDPRFRRLAEPELDPLTARPDRELEEQRRTERDLLLHRPDDQLGTSDLAVRDGARERGGDERERHGST